MSYSKVMIKGRIGYNKFNWPLIVMERARSDNPYTAVLCEVYGLYQECGSVYYGDITLTDDLYSWKEDVRKMGHDSDKHYFKGKLLVQCPSCSYIHSDGTVNNCGN